MTPDSKQLELEHAGLASVNGNGHITTPFVKAPSKRPSHQIIGLAIAAGALGRSVLLQMPDGMRLHAGLSVIIASNNPGPLLDTLAATLSPLKFEQARRHLAAAKLDPESHQKLIEEVAAEREAYVASDGMPSAQDLAYFDQQLNELNSITKPLMLLQNPPPGRLTLAIGKSVDSVLLATFDDLSLNGLLNAARTSRGAMDLELLGKSFRQEIFDAPYLEGISDAPVISPIMTMIAVVRPETAVKFLS
jgi:hypothetical protein